MEKDFRKSIENLRQYENRSETVRLRRMVVNMFKNRYKDFQNNNRQQVDLYAGDFRPLPDKSLTSQRPLQIMLPSDIFMPMEYEELYTKFIKTFTKDLEDHDLGIGKGSAIPEGKTSRLRDFIKNNPGEKIDFTYMCYPLNSDFFTEKRIEVVRYYLDIRNACPLAEVWSAAAYPRF